MVIHKKIPQVIGKPIINKRFHWFAEGFCRSLFLNSVAKPLKLDLAKSTPRGKRVPFGCVTYSCSMLSIACKD